MPITRRELLIGAAAAPLITSLSVQAQAQALSMAKVLVGFPAGGAIDVVARRLSDQMRPTYAKTMVIDNRPGATGQIAAAALKTEAADGSAFLLSPMAAFVIYPFTYKTLPYDPIADFTPVSRAVEFGHGLAVGPAVPPEIHTVSEFMAWCRAHADKANFGTAGNGSAMHFIGALLGQAAQTAWRHVPYRGSQPAIQDLLGGQIPAVVAPLPELTPHLAGGRCRLLATTGSKRSRFFPDTPTLVEQGFADLEFTEWHGFFLSSKASPETVARLHLALQEASAKREYTELMTGLSFEVSTSTPEALAKQISDERERWGKLIASTGFTPES